MFVVAIDDKAPPPISSLQSALKHAYEVLPDVRYRLQPYHESMKEPPPPPACQDKADNDSVRRKLRESLASALEMVVSKQLVKSVLGVITDIEMALEEETLSVLTQSKTQDEVMWGGSGSADEVVIFSHDEIRRLNTHTDGGFEPKADMRVDEKQAPCSKAFIAELSCPRDSHFAMNERPLEKFENEETVPALEKAKSGLQLMEQARKVAWNVEFNLYAVNGGVNRKYKEKARSLLFNLKDKSNPDLRARVFKGEIIPEILVQMSAAQLASKELCQWRTTKAEEFASMVVLTDADIDPRRIVKKTHKGEFQVVVDDVVFLTSSESVPVRPAVPVTCEDGPKVEGVDPVLGRVGNGSPFHKFSNNSSVENREVEDLVISNPPVLHFTADDESMETQETADDVGNSLASMTSRDEYIVNSGDAAKVNAEGHFRDAALETLQNSGDQMWTNLLPNLRTPRTLRQSKSSGIRRVESGCVNGTSFSEDRGRENGSSMWEGSLQLSAHRSACIDGFYKSGMRLELKDWPQSVEVKGRVRLRVLDKFLQDLQLSRSRTVTSALVRESGLLSQKNKKIVVQVTYRVKYTLIPKTVVACEVLSLCPSDCRGDVKQMGAYLKEIADHYRMGDRAGFAEPKPGFELYLLAPGSACLNLLSADRRSFEVKVNRKDEVLVGVVVWRRSQSEGLSSSRGPEQNLSVKKVASSNLVSDSLTEVNVQPLHWTDAPHLGTGFPASLKTASSSSHINVIGNLSMHSGQSNGGASATGDSTLHIDSQQPSLAPIGLQLPPSLVPVNKIIEYAHASVANSTCPLPQWSSDCDNLPPGFLHRPMPSIPPPSSAVLNVEIKHHVQGHQSSPSCSESVASRLVPDGNRGVLKNAPPGFMTKSSEKFFTTVRQKISTDTQQDDDDLPEFNFDSEVEAQQATAHHSILASKTQSLSALNHNILPLCFTGLQHTSETSNTYQNQYEIHYQQSPPVESQCVLNRLPSRHVSKQRVSLAPKAASLVPPSEGWDCGPRTRESVYTTQQDLSRFMLPLNARSHRSVSRRVSTEELISREQLCSLGRSRNFLESSYPVPHGFPTSGVTFLNGAGHNFRPNDHLPRSGLPEWCAPALVARLGWPNLLPTRSDYHPLNHSQPTLLQMLIQHQHLVMKNNAFSSPTGLPFPQQEVQHNEWQAITTSSSPAWSLSTSSRVCHRSRTNLEPQESFVDKARSSEFYVKDMKHSKEWSREPSLGPSSEKRLERWGCKSLTPTREKCQSMAAGDCTRPASVSRGINSPKRKRERERDQ